MLSEEGVNSAGLESYRLNPCACSNRLGSRNCGEQPSEKKREKKKKNDSDQEDYPNQKSVHVCLLFLLHIKWQTEDC